MWHIIMWYAQGRIQGALATRIYQLPLQYRNWNGKILIFKELNFVRFLLNEASKSKIRINFVKIFVSMKQKLTKF